MSDAHSRSLRVVAGYDGSRAAADALHLAAHLAPAASAAILHLWRPELGEHEREARSASLDEIMRAVAEDADARAQRRAADGAAIAAALGWTAHPHAQQGVGDHGLSLARFAEQEGADLVVLGARGLRGARAMLGSVSDSTVHYSPIPVLVVTMPLRRRHIEAAAAGPLLVAFDGSDGARYALQATRERFPNREILGVSVESAGDEHPDAPEGVRLITVPAGRRLGAGRAIADALAAAADTHGAAAIVVGSRGRSARREIALGSAAMATLHHGRHPTVVVPAPATT